MYKYILQSVENVNWLAIGPLIIFFVFFTGVVIMALSKKKGWIEKMGHLPLEEE